MARRKDHTHEEIRALALDALLQHLAQEPPQSLSLRKIAQQVGYSAGTLINVFGSYDHLLLTANAHTLDQLSSQLKQAQAQQQDALGKVRAFAQTYLDFAQQHPFQWQLLFEHRMANGSAIPQWQQTRIDQLFSTLETVLAAQASSASTKQVQEASRTIWASVHGICMPSLDNKLFADSHIQGQSMIDSLIRHYVTDWCRENPVNPSERSKTTPPTGQ